MSPGGACTHWKAPPLHGARRKRTFPNPDDETGERPFTLAVVVFYSSGQRDQSRSRPAPARRRLTGSTARGGSRRCGRVAIPVIQSFGAAFMAASANQPF